METDNIKLIQNKKRDPQIYKRMFFFHVGETIQEKIHL